MNPITVSLLNAHIAALVEQDETLRDLWLLGEVSNWKRAASGHVYFVLKDSGAAISAVMWKGSTLTHTWLPSDGDQIIAHGYVGVYPERGAYQLYVNRIQPAGRGRLYEQLEALKARLNAAGLFDPERKRPLPANPQRIGIITSADAAALRDILRVLAVRWPLVEVIVFPTLVQGNEAPTQIVSALANANRYSSTVELLETLIVARGGGSIEDLWAFNDERVAQAIAKSAIPVVTGVGHETDFTIADWVADLRAPTPSAAAAAVVPDRVEAQAQIVSLYDQLTRSLVARLAGEERTLQQMQRRLQRVDPRRQLDYQRQRLDEREPQLQRAIQRHLERLQIRQRAAHARLSALSPLGVLQRGYSIVQRGDGTVVTKPEQSQPGENLQVRAAGGVYTVQRA